MSTCETCGVVFFKKRHLHQRFCSRICGKASIKRQIQRTCVICGTVFERQAAKISDYCSAKCSYQAQRKDVAEAFWSKVDKTSDCWLWMGGRAKFGHGLFKIASEKRTLGAHRFSYELVHGPIPDGFIICHHCDVPACVRPEHLFLGTHADNKQDSFNKGRHAKGESIGSAKLTESDIHAIRSAPGGWGKIKLLAEHYDIAPDTITRIRKKKLWKHV